jgi:DNA-binding NtrC family response regulator
MLKDNIFLIEDDLLSRMTLETKLSENGKVITAGSTEEVHQKLSEHTFSLAFVDLDLDRELAGLEIVKILKEKNIYAIVLSGREEDAIIETAYNNGCDDYLVKPYTKASLELVFKKYYQANKKNDHLTQLKEKLITEDDELVTQLEIISLSLLSDRPILITGETGTGKTYLAKFIHEISATNSKTPFVHLNCSELSESLLESELFGHVKGAFTGAVKAKKGMLELSDNGILFLDEIATMPMTLQKKLLKAIEEKAFYPLGSETLVHSNFRLISATCENLAEKIAKDEFRSDLYYRLEGFNVHLKALRERVNDLPAILKFFQKKSDRRFIFEPSAKEMFLKYNWPGNMREFSKVMDILQLKDDGRVTTLDLDKLFSKDFSKDSKFESDSLLTIEDIAKIGLNSYMEKIEMDIVTKTLKHNKDKVRKTLTDLKISNQAYYRIMDNIKNSEEKRV